MRVSSTDYLASCGDGAAIRAVLDGEATSAAVTPEPDDVAASDRDRRSPDRARLRIRSFVHDGERHALLVRRADGPAPGQRVRDTEALGAIGRLAADLAGSLLEVVSRAAIEELVASRIADLAVDEAAWTVSGTPDDLEVRATAGTADPAPGLPADLPPAPPGRPRETARTGLRLRGEAEETAGGPGRENGDRIAAGPARRPRLADRTCRPRRLGADRACFVAPVLPAGMQNVDAAGLGIGDDYPPRIMGVLNVSEESPYEPSVFDDPGEAAEYVDESLVGEGADIVDVGLESANKKFGVLSAEEELDRLETAVEAIRSVSADPVFSIETRYHEVAAAALDRGFDMVNDICGFADPEMPRVCEERGAAVVKMASPPDLERPGAVEAVDWGSRRADDRGSADRSYADDVYDALRRAGFTEKTIVDPAFGGWSEAKTLADDRETFRRLREFRALDRPILVSINRKNFLRELAGRSTEAALPVSLAATAMAVERGAHVVRTHDVAETRDAALVGDAFTARRVSEPTVEELDVTAEREAGRHLDRVGGDREAAGAAPTRVFEFRGLAAPAADRLAALADEHGARYAAGGDVDLLFGAPAALRGICGGAEDDLAAALAPVRDALDRKPNRE